MRDDVEAELRTRIEHESPPNVQFGEIGLLMEHLNSTAPLLSAA